MVRSISRIIDVTSWIIAFLVGLRIVLKLLSASLVAPFVEWLYMFTDALIAPFIGIFPSPVIGKSSELDLSAFFALVLYLIIGFALAEGVEAAGRSIGNAYKKTRLNKKE